MTCIDIQARFSEYYDSGCDAVLEEHLKECPSCAAQYKEYAELFNQVRNLPEPAMTPNFHEDLMEYVHINKQPIHKPKPVAHWNVTFSAVAAAAVVLLFVWFNNGTNDILEEFPQYPIDIMPAIEGRIAPIPSDIELNVENDEFELYDQIQFIDPAPFHDIDFVPVMFCIEEPPTSRNNHILVIALCLISLAIGGLAVVNTGRKNRRN